MNSLGREVAVRPAWHRNQRAADRAQRRFGVNVESGVRVKSAGMVCDGHRVILMSGEALSAGMSLVGVTSWVRATSGTTVSR